MKVIYFITFALAFTYAQVNDDLSLWPQPVNFNYGNTPVQVSTNLQFVCEETCGDVLTVAFLRYQKYIFFANNNTKRIKSDAATISFLNISVAESDVPLSIGVDETYQLSITSNGVAIIKANTNWGALRGLDTFSQLVNIDIPSGNYFVQHTPISISDSPRFPWRGLLIDSSRHFLDIPSIMRQLDAMEAGKMNVLHWHLSDDPSFPLESTTFPLLTGKGAWSSDSIYTHDDVQFILQYAQLRGITVIPEFDMPAHANSWFLGYPDLRTPCSSEYYGLFDAANPNTYEFIDSFLTEITTLFPSPFIHLGSDEVGYQCWENSTEIQQFMKENNIANYSGVHNYFEQKVWKFFSFIFQIQKITTALGKDTILWEEAFDSGFNILNNTIIEVWLSLQELTNVVKAGYRAVLAKGYYLDQENPGNEYEYFWEDTWKDFYMNDPVGNTTYTPQELELILGGEACMWGEQVDGHVIDCRIWPRAMAVAERLWSPQSVTDIDDAQNRLIVHRCRLVRRGIGASPLRPDYCYTGQNQHKKWKLF